MLKSLRATKRRSLKTPRRTMMLKLRMKARRRKRRSLR